MVTHANGLLCIVLMAFVKDTKYSIWRSPIYLTNTQKIYIIGLIGIIQNSHVIVAVFPSAKIFI